ncbi:MAG: peptidase dimerization domain-containing protein [Clostridia bacterium]
MGKLCIEQLEKNLEIGNSIFEFLNNNPENSGQEKKACKFLTKLLSEQGYIITSPYKGVKYSFKATKNNKNNRPKVAIICEYDATEGLGHACGHSSSSAASIMTALSFDDKLPFDLDIIGTPNEEVLGGKIQLLQNSAFSEYDMAIMAHMNASNQLYFNTVASCDLYVSFFGKAAHSSINPSSGINALNGVRLMFSALDMMSSSLEMGQSIEGIVKDGGKIPNMIPKKASAYIYLRASNINSLNKLKERVIECIKGVAKATETTNNTTQNCPEYAEFLVVDTNKELVSQVFSELNMPWVEQNFKAGSSDIGNLSFKIPVIHPMIAISHDENAPALYTEEFANQIHGENGRFGMINGANVLYKIVAKLAEKPELMKIIAFEHAQKIIEMK